MIVAIDGPAGAGKSTAARGVARELKFAYVNTGAMYRAVALLAYESGFDLDDAPRLARLGAELPLRFAAGGDRLFVGERDVTDDIMAPEIGDLASRVAALPALRREVVARQRDMGRDAARQGGAVLEGRDIGTVVFPDATLKVFLFASPESRARRRLEQWHQKGKGHRVLSIDDALRDVALRDERDQGRENSPLVAAPDAVLLDSDALEVDEVIARIAALARARGASQGRELRTIGEQKEQGAEARS